MHRITAKMQLRIQYWFYEVNNRMPIDSNFPLVIAKGQKLIFEIIFISQLSAGTQGNVHGSSSIQTLTISKVS